jgi:hypothetical protein
MLNFLSELYPNLTVEKSDDAHRMTVYFYKLRMHHTDISNVTSESLNFNDSQAAHGALSTSLPNTSYLTSRLGGGGGGQPLSPTKPSPLINTLNQLLKQAAYQFHLIFQTKAYNGNVEMIELANHVNEHLQQSTSNSKAQHFCLPQCLNMGKYLTAKLFYDKYYLC